MRTRTLLLTAAALGLAAQTALGVCGPTTARTLAVTDSARIYAVPAAPGKPVKIVGCHLETGGAPVALATQLTRRVKAGKRLVQQKITITQTRINGAYGAIVVRNFDAIGRGKTTVRVVDLRSGAPQFASTKTAGATGRPRDWNVTDLVVSHDGRAAWIGVYRPQPSQAEIWIRAFSGVASIDAGPIDPVSLELNEVPIEDGTIDVGINYTKRGGTEPGNSSLG